LYSVVEWPEDPVYRGHDGARRMISAWTDNFDEWGWHVHEVRDAGSKVLGLVEMGGRIKGSAVPIRQPVGVVCSDFTEGAIGQLQFFMTWQEGLHAVGLTG
jgi:hypothetical protein